MRAGANPAETETDADRAIRSAVEAATAELDAVLKRGARLLDMCEDFAGGASTTALPALSIAAQILRRQSETAERLARVARGETRHRSIVEVLTPRQGRGELNSRFCDSPDEEPGKETLTDDELRERIFKRLFPHDDYDPAPVPDE